MSDSVASALAGAGGGIASMALTYPLITMSTRSQVSKTERMTQLETAKKIISEEGIAGLYSGVSSALFGIAVTNAVYYYWYEYVKLVLEGPTLPKRVLSVGENMLTGAVAGAMTSIITNPIWVINTRLVVKKDSLDDKKSENTAKKASDAKRATFLSVAMKILNEEGTTGFYKGLIPALVLVINPVIQFTVFERLKVAMEKKMALNGFHFFILGAISKLVATGLTYPYIVVKSRMQLKDGQDESSRYSSAADGFKKIIKNEGVQGLYKGIESKLFQSVLTSAFTFALKEEFSSWATWLLVVLKLREEKLKVAE